MTGIASSRIAACRRGLMVAGLSLALAAPAGANPVTDHFRAAGEAATRTIDHSVWNGLLAKYVVPGDDGLNRVRYAAWQAADRATLERYLATLERERPQALSRPEQFAFWVNLYNAKTVDIILDHYPVASIRDITIDGGIIDILKRSVGQGGPWKAEVLTVDGQHLSLDNVEHDILRPLFKDPRVHYAVNCASVGCPNLQREAFTGANHDTLLDAAARQFINSPRGFRFGDGGLWASSIYSWFKADFGGSDRAVIAHAARFAEPARAKELKQAATITDYGYDWALNDAR